MSCCGASGSPVAEAPGGRPYIASRHRHRRCCLLLSCLGSAQPPPQNWRHHRAVDANDAHPKLMDTEMRPRWLPRFPSDLWAAAEARGCVRHRCLQGLFPP
jgi:hypothetical protein